MLNIKQNPCISIDAIERTIKDPRQATVYVDPNRFRIANAIALSFIEAYLMNNPEEGLLEIARKYGIKVLIVEDMDRHEWIVTKDGYTHYSTGDGSPVVDKERQDYLAKLTGL